MNAVKMASGPKPSLAWRPASVAIWIGPPMFDESICRETSFQKPLKVSVVTSHVRTTPCSTEASGP